MSACKHITNTLLGAALGLAALCAAVSCGKASSVDAPVPSPSFTVDDGGAMGSLGIATRTVLSAPDIETRKTSVTLAAYSGGVLYASGHFTSGLDGMRLDLQEGETYDVVALVNMGDMRSSLPSSEDGLTSVTYTIPGYAEVNSAGIPMSGRLDGYRAGPSRGTVPVRRLFAKVTVNYRPVLEDGALESSYPSSHTMLAVCAFLSAAVQLGRAKGSAAFKKLSKIVLWALACQRLHYVIIIMDAFEQAAEQLEALKAELEANPRLACDFPELCGQGKVWRAGVITTATGAKVEVFGAGKKIRGRRHGAHRRVRPSRPAR